MAKAFKITIKRYGLALASVAIAVAARAALERGLGYRHPYATFYIAVLCSAAYGGLGPGLVATVAGASAALLLLHAPLPDAGQSGTLLGFEFYWLVSLTAAILLEAKRREARKSARNAQVARERLVELLAETSQRKQAEEAACLARKQLELTFEHAPVGICRLTPKGSIQEVNTQFCEITGRLRKELLGYDFVGIAFPECETGHDAFFERLLERRIPYYHGESRLQRKDGKAIWVDLTVSLVQEGGGCPAHAIAVIQDITSRRQTEEQLREAQKLESIGLLAGGIAHDFNNLLTGVLGNANLAMEAVPPESPAREMLQTILSAADRAAYLTAQLLAYAGKGTYWTRDVDLTAAVCECIELVRSSLPANVELRLQMREQLPRFRADSSQIQQLIANLVLNAAEAIPEGRPGLVTVGTGLMQLQDLQPAPVPDVGDISERRYLVLRVQDTGAGIEQAIRRRIFDPFFTTKFMGRGLGLAAVAGIVRTLKGAVIVSSRPGEGAAFSILFPLPANDSRQGDWPREPEHWSRSAASAD